MNKWGLRDRVLDLRSFSQNLPDFFRKFYINLYKHKVELRSIAVTSIMQNTKNLFN